MLDRELYGNGIQKPDVGVYEFWNRHIEDQARALERYAAYS